MSKEPINISNEIRCLRMYLTPVLSEHFKKVLQEAESRLANGEVSTSPGATLKKSNKKGLTKKELLNRLLSGKA